MFFDRLSHGSNVLFSGHKCQFIMVIGFIVKNIPKERYCGILTSVFPDGVNLIVTWSSPLKVYTFLQLEIIFLTVLLTSLNDQFVMTMSFKVTWRHFLQHVWPPAFHVYHKKISWRLLNFYMMTTPSALGSGKKWFLIFACVITSTDVSSEITENTIVILAELYGS